MKKASYSTITNNGGGGGGAATVVGAFPSKAGEQIPKKGLRSSMKEGDQSDFELSPGAIRSNSTKKLGEKKSIRLQRNSCHTTKSNHGVANSSNIEQNPEPIESEEDTSSEILDEITETMDDSQPGAVRSNSAARGLGKKKSTREAWKSQQRGSSTEGHFVAVMTRLRGLGKNQHPKTKTAETTTDDEIVIPPGAIEDDIVIPGEANVMEAEIVVAGSPPSTMEDPETPRHKQQQPNRAKSINKVVPFPIHENEAKSILQRRSTKCLLMVVLAIVVAVVVATTTILGREGGDDKPSEGVEPTQGTGPPNFDVDLTLIPGLPDSTWEAIMSDRKSPQYIAYAWIALDPMLEEYEDWQLRQRFALATFYYAMGEWESSNWMDYETNECQWLPDASTMYDQACHDNGNIRFINITRQRGFRGSLPPELALLTGLEGLDFSNNVLGGNIMDLFGDNFFFNQSSLQVFWCCKCRLSGTFPLAFTQMQNLRAIFLNDNDVTGELPSEIKQLSLLRKLDLDRNEMSGPIPTTIGNLRELQVLKLRNNMFNSLPSEVGKLTKLNYLDLSDNRFKQTLPSELGGLDQLQVLELDGNMFQGTIPPQLGSLTKMVRLLLNKNKLSGTIPDQMGSLSSLEWLWLVENQLVGSIPLSLGQLTRLEKLDIGKNMLTSTLPSELGLMLQLQSLDLYTNALSGYIPSEIASLPNLIQFNVEGNDFIVQELPGEFCTNPQLKLITDWCEGSSCCTRRQ